MVDYAAVWARPGEPGGPFVGRVGIEADRLSLEGMASDGMLSSHEVRAEEIEGIERIPGSSLRLDLLSGESFVFSTVFGIASTGELLGDVSRLIAGARSARLEARARRDEAAALREQAQQQTRRARRAIARSHRLRGPGSS